MGTGKKFNCLLNLLNYPEIVALLNYMILNFRGTVNLMFLINEGRKKVLEKPVNKTKFNSTAPKITKNIDIKTEHNLHEGLIYCRTVVSDFIHRTQTQSFRKYPRRKL